MNRHPLGWELPPGVTDRMIDEAAQGPEPADEPFELLADLTDRLKAGERLLAEAVRQLAEAKVELARRNAQVAALLDVAEAAKDLLFRIETADWRQMPAADHLRRTLDTVPKAAP